ncbi:MAG: MASE1 domain-containing protein, partial [Gemmatimonadales bacterium]
MVLAVYLAAAEIGLRLSFATQSVSSLYPAAGIALALLWCFGTRYWPGVFLGALLVNPPAVPAGVALLIAAGNTATAVAGVLLLKRLPHFRPTLDRLHDVLGLVLVSAVMPILSASVGVLALWAAGVFSLTPVGMQWLTYWSGDVLGTLLCAPLLLAWLNGSHRWPTWSAVREATLLGSLLVLTTWAVYFRSLYVPSLLYPLVMWAALRFKVRGATLVAAVIAVGSVWATLGGHGPLVHTDVASTAMTLQIVLGVTVIMGLVIGSVTAERHQAIGAWQGATQDLRAVFDAAPLAVVATDTHGRVTRWNQGAEDLFGWTEAEVAGLPPPGIAPDRQAEHDALQARQLRGEAIVGLETVRQHRRGRPLEVSLSLAGIRDGQGQVTGGMSVIEDIGVRKRAEAALAQQREVLQTIFDHVPAMICFMDAAGVFQWVNRAWRERLGWSLAAMANRDMMAEFYPDEPARARMRELMRVADSQWNDSRTVAQSGETVDIAWAYVRLSDGTTIGIGQDVTQRKETERVLRMSETQLRQSQKMEAIGRLAGGVAHDFNNLLTSIMGHVDLMLDEVPPDHALREDIREVRDAAARAADLTSQLLAFSRKQVIEPRILDLNAAIGRITGMLRRLIGEHIELAAVLEPTLGRVIADPSQVEQVIVNLVVNGRDAMPDGGRLRIETANVVLDAAYARAHEGASPGPHVMVAVIDEGVGIDPEIQAH